MMDNLGQVCGRGRGFHKGAGIRAMGKNRAVREKRGICYKHHIRGRLVEIRKISNTQRTAFGQNQIKNDYIKRGVLDNFKRRVTGRHTLNNRTKALQIAGPNLTKLLITLHDKCAHLYSKSDKY